MNTFLSILALAGIGAGLVGLRNGAVPTLRIANKRQAGLLLSGSLILGLVAVVPAAPATLPVPAVAAPETAALPAARPSPVMTTETPTWTPSTVLTSSPTALTTPTPITLTTPTPTAASSPPPVVVEPAATSASTSTTTRTQTTTTTTRTTTTSAPTVKVYANCAAMNVDYPHGVARTDGVDLVSGKPRSPQPKYKVDDALYDANPGRDGDGDGVACEKV